MKRFKEIITEANDIRSKLINLIKELEKITKMNFGDYENMSNKEIVDNIVESYSIDYKKLSKKSIDLLKKLNIDISI